MFRLLKLAVYALIGYALYEFVQGIMEADSGAPREQSNQPRTVRSAAHR